MYNRLSDAKRLMMASGSWGFIVSQPCYPRYPIIVSNTIVQIKNKPKSYAHAHCIESF